MPLKSFQTLYEQFLCHTSILLLQIRVTKWFRTAMLSGNEKEHPPNINVCTILWREIHVLLELLVRGGNWSNNWRVIGLITPE